MALVTVRIDPDTCVLAASCVGIAPKLFHIGIENYAELIDRNGVNQGSSYTFEATPEELALIEEAVDSCPTRAIVMTAK
jgi:ferredoxin